MKPILKLSSELFSTYNTSDLIKKFQNILRTISYSCSINELSEITQLKFAVPLISLELKKRKAWTTLSSKSKSILLHKEISKYSSKEFTDPINMLIVLKEQNDFANNQALMNLREKHCN